MHTPIRIGLSALALAMAVSFSGCDQKPGAGGEAAAKVNGNAIGAALVEYEVKKLGNLTPEQRANAGRQLLRNLVDQDLLAQKAVADKLDQDATVQLALEAARRQILSQAYVEKLTANVAKPTDQEVADYFAQHPELFSARRIYRLQEISVKVTPDNVEAVKAQLAGVKKLDDFVQWLRAQNIPARISQTTKGAEQLSPELLPRLARMQDGQAMTMQAPGLLNILVRAGSEAQPVSLEQAKSSIERFLINAKKRDMATAALKDLRAQARIEYLGAYADMAKEADKADEPAPAHPAVPAEAAPAAEAAGK